MSNTHISMIGYCNRQYLQEVASRICAVSGCISDAVDGRSVCQVHLEMKVASNGTPIGKRRQREAYERQQQKRLELHVVAQERRKALASQNNERMQDLAAELERSLQQQGLFLEASPQVDEISARERRAKRLKEATPKWADKDKIKKIYELRDRINKRSNTEAVHVDHIIPLQGDYVCGLHVHDNLQILTAHENCAKNNSYQV